jgi:hypothetical protein
MAKQKEAESQSQNELIVTTEKTLPKVSVVVIDEVNKKEYPVDAEVLETPDGLVVLIQALPKLEVPQTEDVQLPTKTPAEKAQERLERRQQEEDEKVAEIARKKAEEEKKKSGEEEESTESDEQ